MRRFNFKLLALLVIATLMVGGGLFLLNQFQVRRSAGKLLRQAKQAEEDKKPQLAMTLYDRYLRYRSNDAEALTRYGVLMADSAGRNRGQVEMALTVLNRALGLDSDNEDTLRRAIRMSVAAGRFQEAFEHANALLKVKPNDSEADLAIGLYHESDTQYDKAAESYRKSIADDPKQVQPYLRLASVQQLHLNAADEADKTMDAMVAANKDRDREQAAAAYLGRSIYWSDKGQLDKAGADATRALELAPESSEVVFNSCRIALQQRDWEEVRRLLEPAVQKFPEDPRFYQALAQAQAGLGQSDEALKTLRRGLKATDDVDVRWMLARLLVEQSQLEEAERLTEELVDRGYDKGRVDVLRGDLLAAKEEWSAAAEAYQRAIPLLGTTAPTFQREANLRLATCYERLGDTASQQEIYRRMASADPGNPDSLIRLARSLETLKQFDEALEQYRLIPNKTPEIQLEMVRLVIRIIRSRPASEQRWEEAQTSLDALAKALPADPRVPILQAEVYLAQDQFDKARTGLERARDVHPDRIELWAALYTLAEQRSQPDVIGPLLDAMARQFPKRVEVRILRARYLANWGGPEGKEQLASLAENADGFPEDDRRRLFLGLADAYTRAGDTKSALALWLRVADQFPRNLYLQLIAFDLAVASSDAKAQGTILERLQKIPGSTAQAFANMAQVRQLITQARGEKAAGPRTRTIDRARALLADLSNKRPSDPRVALGEAEVNELMGNTTAAIGRYLKAVQLGERDPDVIRRTLQLLAGANRYAEARQVLGRLQDRTGISPELQRLESEILFRTQDYIQALRIAQKTVDDGSTDYQDHIWLGQLLWSMGRRADAEAPFRKAVELGGEEPVPVVMLTQYYAQAGQLPKAVEVVNRAEKIFSAEKAPLALAQCYETVGLFDKARAVYLEAMGLEGQEEPDPKALAAVDSEILRNYAGYLLRRNRRREVEPYLQALMNRKGLSAEDQLWSKTILSLILATDVDQGRSRRALELMGLGEGADANLAGLDTEPLADLRAKARVLSVQRDENYRRQAVQILEEVIRRDPAGSGDDTLLLARIHELDGDWTKAGALYQRAIQLNGASPRPLIEYIQALLRHRQPRDVSPLLNKLDTVQPDAAINAQLRALTFQALGQDDQAAGLLLDFGNRHPDQMLGAVRVLETMGYTAQAERALRQFVEKNQSDNPALPLALAEFLGRQGRTREALDLCEPLWKTASPVTMANTCVTILLGGGDEEQGRRVEAWIHDAIARTPDDDDLRVTEGVLRSIQGRAAEAEAVYRKVLEKDAENLVALNNLAWLLAFQDGKQGEALELIERALRQTGPQAAMLDTRAVIYLAQNRSDMAIRDLENALGLAPEASMYYHLARARLMSNQREAAQLAWRDGERLGLKLGSLDPLERPSFDKIKESLGVK